MGDILLRLLWLSEHQVVQTAPLSPLSNHHHYNHKDCHLHDNGADGHLVARLSPRLVISGKYSSSRSSCLKPGRVEKRTVFQDSLIFRVEKRPFWRVGGVDLFFSFSIERMEHLFSTLWQGRHHWVGVGVGDTALFKKMNILFESIFWILKKWIIFLNEYSGF